GAGVQGSHLTVVIELADNGNDLSMVVLDGYHRATAFGGLPRPRLDNKKNTEDTASSQVAASSRKKNVYVTKTISVDVLFLGKYSPKVFLNAATALNIANGAAAPVSFVDQLWAVHMLK
ncbi:unnamed protein product, partial [Ectocarpus sp. 4 AP-2014]